MEETKSAAGQRGTWAVAQQAAMAARRCPQLGVGSLRRGGARASQGCLALLLLRRVLPAAVLLQQRGGGQGALVQGSGGLCAEPADGKRRGR